MENLYFILTKLSRDKIQKIQAFSQDSIQVLLQICQYRHDLVTKRS